MGVFLGVFMALYLVGAMMAGGMVFFHPGFDEKGYERFWTTINVASFSWFSVGAFIVEGMYDN